MSTGMSLWKIDETIAQLLGLLEDAGPDEIAPIQQELERYVGETLPAKVDGYIGIIRQDEAIADAAEAEADRLTKIAKARRARVVWLKSNAKAVMEARGLKRLEGSTGQRLRIQASGGKPALKITNERMVPNSMRRYHFDFSAADYDLLNVALAKAVVFGVANARAFLEIDPKETIDTDAVRKALESPCAMCKGTGLYVQSSEPVPDEFVEFLGLAVKCSGCNGGGKQLVPGAELEPRASHLRVE